MSDYSLNYLEGFFGRRERSNEDSDERSWPLELSAAVRRMCPVVKETRRPPLRFATPPAWVGMEGPGGREEGPVCSVCLEQLKPRQAFRTLPDCSHAFHEECITKWIQEKKNCPYCRTALEPGLLVSD